MRGSVKRRRAVTRRLVRSRRESGWQLAPYQQSRHGRHCGGKVQRRQQAQGGQGAADGRAEDGAHAVGGAQPGHGGGAPFPGRVVCRVGGAGGTGGGHDDRLAAARHQQCPVQGRARQHAREAGIKNAGKAQGAQGVAHQPGNDNRFAAETVAQAAPGGGGEPEDQGGNGDDGGDLQFAQLHLAAQRGQYGEYQRLSHRSGHQGDDQHRDLVATQLVGQGGDSPSR